MLKKMKGMTCNENRKNIKTLCWMSICSFLGIILGIIVADSIDRNIGVGISLGWSIGFLVGAVISFVGNKLRNNKTDDVEY